MAIANHGTKNGKFLERLIAEYRGMSKYLADIVVLSNIEKNCGPDVEVLVGVPHKNPWSLPFAHKKVFAERAREYDLFIYSEDDTLITERNIDAFLRTTNLLPRDHIAGFIRYELAPDGARTFTTMHGRYHWDCNSVLRIGDHAFAYYTNEHSACYILTQEQLVRAIASGGFLLPPREGRYDMLVTAATDPYTQCGMRKMICISHLEEFCLHHLPNVYWHRMGLPAATVEREIAALLAHVSADDSNGPLFRPDPALPNGEWDKEYYGACRKDVVKAIPRQTKTLLSVGCGCGNTEAALKAEGIEVTAIPMDRVVGAAAADKGLRMLPPAMEKALREVDSESFDCVLLDDVLCRVHDPRTLLRRVNETLSSVGRLVITVRNGGGLWRWKATGFLGMFRRSQREEEQFQQVRYQLVGLRTVEEWLQEAGFTVERVLYDIPQRGHFLSRLTCGLFDTFLAREFVFVCRRSAQPLGKTRRIADPDQVATPSQPAA